MAGKLLILGCWPSPFSCRVELALKLKGIHYDFNNEDLPYNKSDLLLKSNPVHKKVPVLILEGKPIAESLIILEYIDETWKSEYPLLPEDPHDRAVARFWAKFIDDKFLAALLKAMKSEGGEREKAAEEGREALKELENEIEGKRFFGGERIGFVDIVAVIVAFWAPVIEQVFGIELMSAGKFPNLQRWSEEFVGDGVVKENLPARDELAERFRVVYQRT